MKKYILSSIILLLAAANTAWGQTYVAETGGTQYESLQAAINAAQAGETIKLLNDITVTSSTTILKSVTIDFNGCTITATDEVTVAVFQLGTSSTEYDIVFKDESTGDNKGGIACNPGGTAGIRVSGNNHLTVSDITISDASTDIVARDQSVVTITGGTFNGSENISMHDPATVSISGGTFSQPVDATWCAEGYEPVDNGNGTYGVRAVPVAKIVNGSTTTNYPTLQAAVDAANAGETITLLKDIDLGSSYQIINKAVTIDGGTNQYEIKGTGSSSGTDTESTIVLQGSGAVTLKNLKITNSSSNNNGVGIRGTAYSGKLTIDNCVITVPMRGVNVMTIADGFSMDITGSTIQSNVTDPTTAYVDAVDSRGISFSDEDELATTVTITNTTIQGFKNDIYVDATKKNLTLTMDGVEAYGLYMLNLNGTNNTVNLNGGTTFSACTNGGLVTDEAAYAASTNIIYLDEATKTATSNNVLSAVTALTTVSAGTGKYKLVSASAAVAQIGDTKYETLQAAVDAANAGETIKVIVAGDYTLPNLPKNITIEGTVDGVVFNHTTAGSVASIPNGATFKNVTFNFGNVNYHGFQHAGTINMEGCTLNGKFFSYGDMNFTDCSFNQSNSDYHMWAYSGNLTYTDCTFTNSATGKFINVYNESGATKYTVTTTNCTFVNQGSSNKAALNVKATSGSNLLAYDVIINNCTTEGAFPEASASNALVVLNSVVQVDDRTASGVDNITVTQDGVLIYPAAVAKIGDTNYVSLAAAVAAAQAGDVITMIADDNVSLTAAGSEVTIDKPLTITGAVDESGKPKYTIFGSTSGALSNSSFNDLFLSCSTGTVTISNVKFDGFGNEISSVMGHSPIFIGSRNQNAVIENVYISNLNCEGIHINGGTFTINNCNIDCSKTTNSIFTKGICVVNDAEGTIENTTITGVDCDNSEDTSAAIELQGSGDIAISGCTIQTETIGIANTPVQDLTAGTSQVTISDCTITSQNIAVYSNGEKGALTSITSGRYSGLLMAGDNGEGLSISGGMFDDEPEQAYCAEGYAPAENTDAATMATYPYTVQELPDVAQIGDVKYKSLQAAVDAAHEMTGDVTIELLDDISGYSIVHQKAGLNLTIDGKEFTLNGQIIIDGDGRASGTETLTIQNIKFEDDLTNFYTGTDAFVLVPSTKDSGTPYYTNKYNYAHNITISDCSFTSTAAAFKAVGFKSTSGAGCYNLVMSNVSGDNLHSLAQLTGTTGATFDNCSATQTGSFIGVNGGGGTYIVSNCTFESHPDKADGYAYREKSSSTAVATLTNNNFKAFDAIILGSAGTINVESGTYDGHVSKTAGTIAISGGYFSEEFPQDYIAADLVAQGKVCAPATDKPGYFTVGDPHYVAQIGEAKYVSLQAAVDAAKALGGEVTINIIDDISGETVTIQEVANFKLTIDGQKDATSNYTVDAKIIVDGLRGNGGSITNGASVTLQNIAFVNEEAKDVVGPANYPHDLTIQDCTYTGSSASLNNWFLNVKNGPLYGATVKNVTVEHSRLIQGDLSSEVVFENIVATNDATCGFNIKTSDSGGKIGTVLVKDCQITTAKYALRDYQDGYNGTITLEGNTFTSTSEASDEGVIVNRGGVVGTNHINVESGTYTGHVKVLNGKEGVLAISGGYFSEEFPDEYIAEALVAEGNSCVPAADMEGYFTVGIPNYVAQIGEDKYVSLQAAVDAVPADGTETTIVMINDETINTNAGVTIPAGKNVVLDLNGKTVKGVVQSPASAQTILNMGTLVVTDNSDEKNGTLTNEVSDENAGSPMDKNWYSNVITNNGTLTVNAGNIVNTGTGGACYAIDNITNSTSCTPVLNVAGGNISAKKVAIRMFCNSTTNDNTVNVTGGVISSENAYAIQAQQANNNANKATLTISGGTLSGQYAFCDYGNKNVATQFDNASYSITGGFFTGYIWSYATYYCGMEGFVSGGYFSNEIGGDIVAPGKACVANTDEATMAAYPYTIGQADIYYYWLDNNNQIAGGGYYTIYAPFAGPDPVLMDGEFVELQKNVTLTKDIEYIEDVDFGDPIFKGGTFTLTFGQYNINLNGFHFPIPTGVTILTDKQTNIFSALEEGYEVVEETKETGYAYSVKKSIANPDITIIVDPATYNGTALTPVVTVKDGTTELVQGTDYTISYKGGDSNSHLVDADTYVEEIVITGIGNYGGTRYADFIILPLNLTDYVVTATAPYVEAGYGTAGADGTSGATVKEAATITIKNGSNETLSNAVLAALDITIDNDPTAANNYNNTGTYEGVVHVTPKVDNSDPDNVIDYGPNFTGTIAPGNLVIGEGIDITNSLVVTTPNAIYTGAALPPSADNMVVKVGEQTLTYGTHYTFTFNGVAGDYVDAKTYQNAITITGLGEYEGTFKTDYVIAPRDLSDEGITVTTTNLSYLNTEQAVTVGVKYGNNTIPAANYTYTPNTVTEAGKHIITINAVENSNLVGSTTVVQWVFKSLEGDYAADFTVEPDPIPTQNWTGSEIKPTIIVKDKDRVMQLVDANDGDYSIVYSDNIDEGEATITITGRYAYSGSITKHFTIVSAYFTENGITYHHANEGEEVTVGNTGKTLAVDTEVTGNPVTVPTTVEHGGKSFTVIGVEQNAFGSDAITGIVLPESIAEVENGAFSGADNLHYVDLSTATGFTPSSLQRNIAASPFNGVPKQALVFLNGTTFTGENYVYNPGSGNQYYCEVFKIYDDLSGAQTGFGGNDYKWAFENPHEFTAYSVENTRQLTAERHYTICLPYALEIPNNVKAYTLEATSDKLFGFTEVTGTLAAYTPYVLIPTKSGQLLGTNNNTVVPAFPATADTDATTLNGTTANSFTMYGTMRYMEGDAAQGKYIMQYNNGNPTWKKITEASAGFEASNKACILPMRAYIINGTGGSREFFDVVFTNIDGTTLTFDKLRFDDDTIYDLSGRKVELLERGHTYIINGKKVMVK